MTETSNYKMKKPGENDYADISVLNANMDILDGTLHEHASDSGVHITPEERVQWDNKLDSEHNNSESAHPDIRSALDEKAALDHTHDTGDIISGTLPVSRGGTGATDAAAALSNLGGLPKAGGVMTGNISIEKSGQKASLFLVDAPNGAASLQSGAASASDTAAILYGFEVPEGLPPGTIVDNDNYTAVYLGRAATPNINALRLVRKISGSITTYSVYGTHNITVSQTAPSSALSNGAMHMVY